jgi:16S rRNA (cytosine1402-N4)-methyltransferase
MRHIPVMLTQVLEYLLPRDGECFVDATAGGGGHLEAILKRVGPNGKVIGIDCDLAVISRLEEELKAYKNLCLIHGNFSDLKEHLKKTKINQIDGVFWDLGLSSIQLDDPSRGLSFDQEGPLDMRLDPSLDQTAEEVINQSNEQELNEIFKEYGDEPRALKLARSIVQKRKSHPIKSTQDFTRIILSTLHPKSWPSKQKILARNFQAIRIAVNNELERLKTSLQQAFEALSIGGRLVTLAFHSGEDRIVKHFIRSQTNLEPFFKKPLRPSPEEIRQNPRSRSAMLRAARKVA